ncbi:glycosyltransferase family 39 protein [candidate division FCPU426 bacterium]|nr:glycosyltransferase family 39 protein [candidate division FCPU426 bacterium]
MDKYRKLFWLALGTITVFRLFFIGSFELSPDEAYYWTWSRHLDWAYFDQGPMLALVIRFFTALSGKATATSIRLGAVLLSVLTAWIFFELVTRMFRSTLAGWYGFWGLQSALLVSAGAVLMMHDSIMVSFWVAGMYAFWRATAEHWAPGWFLGALALGLGALAKFTMALFIPCLLLFILLSPPQRQWWRQPHLYLAGLLTLALVLPVLVWNASHGWVSFGHVGDLGGVRQAFTLSWKTALGFLGGQIAVMTPFIGAFCLAAPAIAWKKWARLSTAAEPHLFLACFSGPVLIFFFLLSWRTEVYANWPAPAYPAALAILAGWLTSLLSTRHARAARRWALFSLAAGMLMTITAHVEVAYGILPVKGNAAESVNRIRGWSEAGQKTGSLLSEFRRRSRVPVFLASRRYQIASILSFYTPGRPEVQLLPLRQPANSQYRFWDRSRQLQGYNALYVAEFHWEHEHLVKYFERIEPLPPMVVMKNGKKIREFRFFFAYNYKPESGTALVKYGNGKERIP